MPAASVKLAEVRSKIVFQKHPALARLGRFDATLAGVDAQDGRRHAQEASGFLQVEGAHGLLLVMVGHPHVVATRLALRLAADVGLQLLRVLPHRVAVVRLQRLEVLAHPVVKLRDALSRHE